jgi:hypothetical protein
MININEKIIKYQHLLNDSNSEKRLENLKLILKKDNERLNNRQLDYYTNNHIHTKYSFSYYSPVMSVWMAYLYNLKIAGIVDHDTVSGVAEFVRAGKMAGIHTTRGVECRVDFSGTPLNGRFLNNPDQESIAYVVLHGIPDSRIDKVNSFFDKYRRERNKRNLMMVEKLNQLLRPLSIFLDFHRDVLPLSWAEDGGTVTERHILFALAGIIDKKFSSATEIINFLKNKLKIEVSEKNLSYLRDKKNYFYRYDILNVLKSSLVEKFFIDATSECPDVREFLSLADETQSISAYAYLGDVSESVTGDKKTQKFEDSYLELLFDVIKDLGFKAVTYMPARNSIAQLRRVRSLCEKHNLFQISGEDINSPRQSFICETLGSPEFRNLIDAAWALIGNEKMLENNFNQGMFSSEMVKRYPDINERIQVFKKIGKGMEV